MKIHYLKKNKATTLFTIEQFASEIGYYNKEEILHRIKIGMWKPWKEYIKTIDGKILISLSGIHKWIRSGVNNNNGD